MNSDDERFAVRLLSPLAGEPQSPSRVDVARAMREGRQRRRSRWWATGAVVTALTAASITGGTLAVGALHAGPAQLPQPTATAATSTAAQPAAGRVSCQVTRLPSAGAAKALVTGGDPGGRYLVGRTYPTTGNQNSHPVAVWRDGELVDQVRLPGADGTLKDINGKGVAVGSSFPSETEEAWSYTGGLHAAGLPGGVGAANAINEAGVIVGDDGRRPVRWASVTARRQPLALPAGATEGSALGIDEDGTIVGTVGTATTETGYLWLPDGTGRFMPRPAVKAAGRPATSFWPESIRGGWVTGRAAYETAESTTFTPYRYSISKDHYDALPEEAMEPAQVAANGWVAGTGAVPLGGSTAEKPALFTTAGTVWLPTYGEQGADYVITSLSDDGLTIGGYSADDSGETQPLVWRCR